MILVVIQIIYIYIYIYIYRCMHTHTHTHIYIYIYIYMRCMHRHIHKRIQTHTDTDTDTHTHTHTHIYIYVYIYTVLSKKHQDWSCIYQNYNKYSIHFYYSLSHNSLVIKPTNSSEFYNWLNHIWISCFDMVWNCVVPFLLMCFTSSNLEMNFQFRRKSKSRKELAIALNVTLHEHNLAFSKKWKLIKKNFVFVLFFKLDWLDSAKSRPRHIICINFWAVHTSSLKFEI